MAFHPYSSDSQLNDPDFLPEPGGSGWLDSQHPHPPDLTGTPTRTWPMRAPPLLHHQFLLARKQLDLHGYLSSTSSLIPPAQSAEPTGEELAAQIARELLEDQCVVDEELKRYEDAGTVSLSEQLYDLTREWERTEHVFPLLFRVAMDVLPVQASSVPCERVFSSSKETCALRRNRMSPKHMEGLQLLKFSYKQDRLTFTDDLLAKEVDYNISGPITSAAIDELVRTDRLSELRDLLANVDTD